MLKGLVPFIPEEEIQSICQRLAAQITEDYKELEPVLIAPLKGSIFFLNQLIQYIDFPINIDVVSITNSNGFCRFRKDISLSLEKRHVLIIEEIVDTGRKTHFLKERILLSQPASLKVVSLLDKQSRRSLLLQCDYVGKKIDDRFVVGCGMDADELGRNYKDIFIFAQ